jgi:HD-like signal output (HDOD) protein
MGLLTRIFGSKDIKKDIKNEVAPASVAAESARREPASSGEVYKPEPSSAIPIQVDMEVLKQLFPIRNLGEEELTAFAEDRRAEVYGPGTVLFRRGDESFSVFFLLEGTVNMEVDEFLDYEVRAHTAKARFPLCGGKRYSATATAQTDVQVLRVSPKIMARNVLVDAAVQNLIDPVDPSIPENVRSSRLFQAFCQHYRDESLSIPSLPEVAMNVRRALAGNADIKEVVRIVEMDPAIAAKLVSVANSPLYLPISPVISCKDAVLRLGLKATRNLVVSYSLRQIFQGKDAYIDQVLHEEWKKSIYLSCLCFVLAAENRLDAEEALLAGLICDIGAIPILYFAENFPRQYWTPEDLRGLIAGLRGQVGAYVLSLWDFPQELVDIPMVSEDWFYDSGPNLNIQDIAILSKLHACIGTVKVADVPQINSVPACGKLKDHKLSPRYSLKVLHDAQDKINQAMRLFDA